MIKLLFGPVDSPILLTRNVKRYSAHFTGFIATQLQEKNRARTLCTFSNHLRLCFHQKLSQISSTDIKITKQRATKREARNLRSFSKNCEDALLLRSEEHTSELQSHLNL